MRGGLEALRRRMLLTLALAIAAIVVSGCRNPSTDAPYENMPRSWGG